MAGHKKTSSRCRFVLSLVAVLFLGLGAASAPTLAADVVVRVGVYENAPKIFTSESGQASGIFIDVIEYIAKQEGWNLFYVYGTWKQGLERLEAGEIDLMPDVARTPEREAIYAFHDVPVLSSWSQVYARKGQRIRSLLDLNGKRIAVLEGSIQQEVFSRLAAGFELNTTLVAAPDYLNALKIVANGDADAAITNNYFGLMNAKEFGLEDTAIVFNPSALYFAASRQAPRHVLNVIDRYLTDLKKDSQSAYYQSLKRWTEDKVRFKLPAWIYTVGLVAGVILLMSLMGSALLKYQVNARTRELREINREMEQRILDRTAELAVAMEKAQAADQLKSAFLAIMSHELRTPLNSIIGFTGIMLQELAGPLNEEQHKQLSMVQNSSRHLLALINDVLDISKIEAGQLDLSYASFELKPSIEKMVKLVSPLAEQKGIELKMDIADDIDTATLDQRRFEQILLNLLNNAVKFTEKGHVRLSCQRDNGDYVLAVSDTGIGIRPEGLADLFQPFHQLDTGLARKHEGTGLGLSICRKLLDMMGGTIGVASQWGRGSTFTVRFPKERGNLS